jgi:hypothetical protein
MILLAIDDAALPLRKDVGLYLSAPAVRREPVLAPGPAGSPDDCATHFYGTVLHDEGRFRMWYYACHWGLNPDWPPAMQQQLARSPAWMTHEVPLYTGPICYAESDDGLTWHRPALGQVCFKGNRANNAIAIPHTLIGGVGVVKDADDPDPARRYKSVYQFFPDQCDPVIPAYGTRPTIALATSPDGLAWTVTGIPFRDQFIEPSSFVKVGGRYIVHYQVMDAWAGWRSEGGAPCGRTGVARATYDWDAWPDLAAEAFALPEPEDPAARGMHGAYPQVHLGVGAAAVDDVCVGLYGLWHNDAEFGRITGDLGLLVSNDGVRFREPVKGHRWLRADDSPATPVPGHAFRTVLCQANGILNVGDETRIYHGRWRNAMGEHLRHYAAEVGLATLPRDRWGALGVNPDVAAGAVCSAPLTLPPGACLWLNADGVAGMRVTLLDAHGAPTGITGTLAGADGLNCPVRWSADLPDTPVRVHVALTRGAHAEPRLYALRVTAAGS